MLYLTLYTRKCKFFLVQFQVPIVQFQVPIVQFQVPNFSEETALQIEENNIYMYI